MEYIATMDTIKQSISMSRIRSLFRVLCLPVLFVGAPSQAATEQTLYGGSGIGVMRTAEMMLPGEFTYNIRGSMFEYELGGATTEVDSTAYVGISFGMGEYMEIGFSAPYQMSFTGGAPAVVGGVMPLQGYVKMSFTGYVERGFASGLTLYGSYAPSTPSIYVSSGINNYGMELNFSHFGERSAVHMNIGYGSLDDRVQTGTGAGLGSYNNTNTYYGQLGMEMYLNESLKASFTMTGSTTASLNENVSIATGFHYIATPKTIITLGTNTGFPTNRSNPQTGYYVVFTYSPNGQLKREPNFKKDLSKLEQQNQRIENKLTELDKKLDEMNSKLEQQQQSGDMAQQGGGAAMAEGDGVDSGEVSPLDQNGKQGNGIRVIVINASGKDGMGGKVADMLRAKGYEVVAVESMDETTPATWIHYNTGFSKQAVELDGLFPGNQHVVRRDINHADIIIIVGADQVE